MWCDRYTMLFLEINRDFEKMNKKRECTVWCTPFLVKKLYPE